MKTYRTMLCWPIKVHALARSRTLAVVLVCLLSLAASACTQDFATVQTQQSPAALDADTIQRGADVLSTTLMAELTESLTQSLTDSLSASFSVTSTESAQAQPSVDVAQAVSEAVARAVAEAVPAAVARGVSASAQAVGAPAELLDESQTQPSTVTINLPATQSVSEASPPAETALGEAEPAEAAPTEPPPAESAPEAPVAVEIAPAESGVAEPSTIVGLGILGDSTQDEYQGTNPRGNEFVATTLNWVELLASKRGLNLGPWGTYDEPRREGYAFNWARSGATTVDLGSNGQVAGVVEQCKAHEVSHVLLQIGINDFYFSGLALEHYAGNVDAAYLQGALETMATNIVNAAIAVRDTGYCHILVGATQNYIMLPLIPEQMTEFPDPEGTARIENAFTELNRLVQTKAEAANIPFFDFNREMKALLDYYANGEGSLVIAGEHIDLATRGDGPRFGILDDGYAHPSTVISALFANIYIAEMNRRYGTSIPLLSDEEIVAAAGIAK
jgi:lysophospholipase L1-like esterase